MDNTKQITNDEITNKLDNAVSELIDVIDFGKDINEKDKSLLLDVIYDLNRLSERKEK